MSAWKKGLAGRLSIFAICRILAMKRISRSSGGTSRKKNLLLIACPPRGGLGFKV
jgi:hypothetical protein